MESTDTVPAVRRKRPPAHMLLALPGVLAGVGGALFWLAQLAVRMGLAQLWRGFKAILSVIVLIGAGLAIYGCFFALPLTAVALIVAVIKSVRRRSDDRVRRAAWIWAGLSAAGFFLGLSVLGQLR